MRTICIASFLLVITGCTSDTLDNTTYRRLVDQFDTESQCLETGNFTPCYQTLTFCADGRVNANLDYRQEGDYTVRDSRAIARLPAVTAVFDLDTLSSPQLPGRHRWEQVEPLSIDCAGH